MWYLVALLFLLLAVVAYDLTQKKHAILRNFPVVGHFRYWFEAVGPELRQYIVTGNDEERPFSRDERRWVYSSSKLENNYFGFGTDNDLEGTSHYPVVRHAAFPLASSHPGDPDYDPAYRVPCAKVLGGAAGRAKAFRPASVVNVSGMSFGSLSAPAVEALNLGARIAGCLHNTGEGGIAPYHDRGGELVWQIGTGYFGCRDERGGFDLARFLEAVERFPVRAVEIKLSQGAKPGLGGVLPGAKVSPEIARIRGVPVGKTVLSPARHSAFDGVDGLLDFAEHLAAESGLPIGIKSAVGEVEFWRELARLMATTGRALDFITVDGGEGGTGAGPLAFTDHVALPFKLAFREVYSIFAEQGLTDRVVFVGSGKLGFPESALLAMALGCDLVAVGREAMMAVGCIQAQRCHTGHCPTGVATQNRWLMRGLDPELKSARLANYVVTLRKELLQLARACGVPHPALVTLDRFEFLEEGLSSRSGREVFGYEAGWGLPGEADRAALAELMAAGSPAEPAPAPPAATAG